ncbi:hypothetical protein DRJ17_04525 [Candidatus Woesearchaeota archaeon]|nr:MAG: hypothetical protein DRJ17_04525 [Candidatus Woesearchaeota archaeon]
MKSVFESLMAIDTQLEREKIIEKLKELFDICYRYSTDKRLNVKRREKWARLAAYIAQTINSILNSYDEQDIKKQLELLKEKLKLLEEMME